jgi:hypothetical protein
MKREADNVTRLISSIRWHRDQADNAVDPRDARRHKDIANQLINDVRILTNNNSKIERVLFELLS